jgi:ketosteroid isomerase-like protein
VAKVEIPHFNAPNAVSGSDRADVIEFVNRVNWFFDIWDVEAIVAAFAPDVRTRHPHRTVNGRAELREFLKGYYGAAVPGVSREAVNHIVDADGDDVVVRYHSVLIRYATPADAESVHNAAGAVINDDGLPAIFSWSPVMDRLRRTDGGWEIVERLVGGTVVNDRTRAKQG